MAADTKTRELFAAQALQALIVGFTPACPDEQIVDRAVQLAQALADQACVVWGHALDATIGQDGTVTTSHECHRCGAQVQP